MNGCLDDEVMIATAKLTLAGLPKLIPRITNWILSAHSSRFSNFKVALETPERPGVAVERPVNCT